MDEQKDVTQAYSENQNEALAKLQVSAANHYKSFATDVEAKEWITNKLYDIFDSINHCKEDIFDEWYKAVMQFAVGAKNPLQFLSQIRGIIWYTQSNMEILRETPITQDASASAYQLMSYFMLDETKRRNLFPSEDGIINDIYDYFSSPLLVQEKE